MGLFPSEEHITVYNPPGEHITVYNPPEKHTGEEYPPERHTGEEYPPEEHIPGYGRGPIPPCVYASSTLFVGSLPSR